MLYQRLLHNLKAKGVALEIVRQIRSFLSNQSTTILIELRTSSIRPVLTGIPLGSPFLPILFLFFNTLLIKDYIKLGLPLRIGGFVDNIYLLTYGISTRDNYYTLKRAHKVYANWVETYSASFAPKKYELLYLTRLLKRFDITVLVNIATL